MPLTHAQGPPPPQAEADEDLTTTLRRRAWAEPDRAILSHHDGAGWQPMTWSQVHDRVRQLAAGLISLGLDAGDRVALMANTRIEWTLADYAVLMAGGVTVPVYETSSASQCAWILSDAEPRHAIVATADYAKRLEQAHQPSAGLREIYVIDDGGLDRLAEHACDETRAEVDRRQQALGTDTLASIIYTSGTTGNPKGCMLTHGNLLLTARATRVTLAELFSPQDSTLLFLPLAHSFARIVQFACVENGVHTGYARSLETMTEDLPTFRPTFLLGVPRVFEKVFNGAQRKAGGGLTRKLFAGAVATARAWSLAESPGVATAAKRALFDKAVYAKLRTALGGRVRYAISGGAPLAPHIAAFFHAAGVPILEGYGLTETSAATVVNPPKGLRIGTVGRPLAGVEIKIDEDGEVLLHSPGVFAGYWRNEQATREAFTADGWYRTGDLGALTDEGYLEITGRKKELIVTAGGKNVAPAVLEERLKAHRLVSQAMVVGDNRAFVTALITLDADELSAFARENALEPGDGLADHPRVGAELQAAVDHANAAVSQAESVRAFRVLQRDFTEQHGELTPTMKIKRPVVAEHFADEIEELYRQ
jgi:long-chain acyl-CoA synthetase